jgi:hypothetical protein
VGIICVVAGIAAMLSQKRRGRYSTFGTIYYWCLSVLVVSATGLSLVRSTENYHLFFLGALSFIVATIAHRFAAKLALPAQSVNILGHVRDRHRQATVERSPLLRWSKRERRHRGRSRAPQKA